MRVHLTLDFSGESQMSPRGFEKWLEVHLSEHFNEEHEWDEATCPALRAVRAQVEARTAARRRRQAAATKEEEGAQP